MFGRKKKRLIYVVVEINKYAGVQVDSIWSVELDAERRVSQLLRDEDAESAFSSALEVDSKMEELE